MKKIILFVFILLLSIASVSAYNTVVGITITSMRCEACASPDSITRIDGELMGRTVCLSTTSACSCDVPYSSYANGNYIAVGDTYYTYPGQVTALTTYYACVKLQERNYGSGSSRASLLTCGSPVTTSNYAFTITGTTCGGYGYQYIGTASVESLIFGYQFTTW